MQCIDASQNLIDPQLCLLAIITAWSYYLFAVITFEVIICITHANICDQLFTIIIILLY